MKRTILAVVIGFIGIGGLCPSAWAFHGMQGGTVSAQADPYSGGASFSVPIEVPPGRAGIQPGIQLQYNSSLPNGLLGVGWSLELGAIQRSTHKGVPSYTNSDEFVLIQSGSSQELVYDSTAGFYRAKTEGAFMKIEFVNNAYWRVTDKRGTRYYFGEDQASREYDPANTARVFKWALNRVEDAHGNGMTVSYFKADNRLYPEDVLYTANAQEGLSSFARVLLNYATNPNQRASFISGFQIKTTQRLSQINVYGGGILQRIYKLNYAQSAVTGRSLVTSIVHSGSDQTTALPARSFSYQDVQPSYYAVQPVGSAPVRFPGDFNGDGLSDVALFTSSSGQVDIALSGGSVFQSPQSWISNFGVNQNILAGDFNADGMADIGSFESSTGNWEVAYATGNAFADMGAWISGFGAGGQPGTGDFNGDGLTDIINFYKTGGNLYARIAVNKGGYFQALNGFDFYVGAQDDIPLTLDFNADGLTDLVSFDKVNGRWFVYWNEGDLNGKFTLLQTITGFGTNYNPVIADFNADNLPDIGYFDPPTGNVFYRISDEFSFYGSSFVFSTGFNVQGADAQVQSADFNGDGLADFAGHNPSGDKEVRLSDGLGADLLLSVDNGVSGVTAITYQPSTQYTNTYLPFFLPLVKSVQNSNGRGDVFETRYSYAGGYWDKTEREFRGFESVTVTDPQDNYTQIRFLQDPIFKGRVVSEKQFDAAGNPFTEVQNTWKSQEITPGVNFVYLYRKDNLVYDGNSSGRRTSEEYFHEETPQGGNLTRVEQYGEVDLATGNDIGNDKRSVETAYVNNTSSWLLGLPRQTLVKDNAGTIVRQSWFYYDNQGNTAAPVKGLLTKKEDWAGTGNVNPVTQYTYDTAGNLLTTTDPQGNITRVAYDTTYNMFPMETENALGHKVTNEYYGVNGVPLDSGDGFQGLWGQLKSTTDPNQQQGRRSYDVFGRPVMTVGPKDSVSYPTQTTSIEYFSDYTKVTSRQRIQSGQAQTLDTVSFYDGFDRLIQTKTPTEILGRYVVSGQAEYNSRGLKNKQYLPHFSDSPVDSIDYIDSTKPYSAVEYDALSRVVKTINADGTYASVIYDDWTTIATDENGHKQASYFDAFGRLIKKEEYTGADGRSPFYSPIPYTLYATTLYLYDSEGNLVQTRDAYNNMTTITYDTLGRKTAMTDPDMGTWSYAYDLNGNLTSQSDAKGQTLNFTYDALNRLTNKTDGINGTVNVNYAYDNASSTNSKGRLTQATYSGGNTQFAYDELGRELQSIKTMNTTGYEVNRGYDALNNLLQIQYPDQKNIYYQYNSAGQIESVANDQTMFPTVGLNPPELGVIKSGDAKVQIFWTTVPGSTGYRVKYGTASGSYTAVLDVGNATGVILSGLTNETTYYFAMVAYNADSESGLSNERSAMPTFPPSLLLPFDGKDAAVTATDLAGRHTVSFQGNAQLDTAQKKFGTASLLLDGNGDYLTAVDHDDWNFGTGDFTIDTWVMVTNTTVIPIASQITDYDNYWNLYADSTALTFDSQKLGGYTDGIRIYCPFSPAINTWYHIAITRSSNTWYMFINGVSKTVTKEYGTYSASLGDWTGSLAVGRYYSNAFQLAGWIDEFRVSKGVARWTSNFTPLASPYDQVAFAAARAPALNQDWFRAVQGVALAENKGSTDAPTSYLAHRVSSLNKRRGMRDEGRMFFSIIAAWLERTLLGVGEAEAQAALPDSFKQETSSNGLVSIETENYHANVTPVGTMSLWEKVTTTGQSGTASMTAMPNRGVINDTTYTTASPRLDYKIKFVKTGTHYIWIRGIGATTADDSVHAGLDGQALTTSDKITGFTASWTWSKTTEDVGALATINVATTGEHTLNLWMREDGIVIDKIVVTASSSYAPSGTGPAQSPQVPPAAPVLNSATAGNAQVSLSWGAVTGATGYKVKYGTTGGTYTTTLDAGNVTSYSAAGLTNGKTYYFVVTAYNSAGTSANSNEKSAVPTIQPFATTLEAETMPTKTTGGATTGGWNIWSNGYVEDTITFPRSGTYEFEVVARGSVAAGVWPNMQLRLDQVGKADITVNTTAWKSFIKQVSVASGSHKVAIAFTNDYYVAPDDRNLYVDKVIIREITSSPPPAAPVLNTATAGDKQVTLSWTASSGATGYKVYYGTSAGVYGTPLSVGNTTTTTVTGLTNGTAYYFAVSAYNAGGGSVRSNELSATPVAPAPTVTLTASPAAMTAGESTTLTWSSTNADDCSASGGWSGAKPAGGNTVVTPAATTTYTLTCTGTGGSASASVEVAVNPLIVQESPTLYVKNVDYNAAGQMTKVEYGNGDVTYYTYDALTLRLTRIYTLDANRSTLQDLSYTYDSVGNILSITDNVNTADQTFKYDELNRLTEATNPNPGSYGTKSYVYDALGNIVEKDGKTYFYGENGVGPHAVTSLSDGTTFGYDANGNMVTKIESGVTTAYTYDAENRLTKVIKNGSTIGQYEYDGDGGRTKKTATVSGQTTTTTFVGSLFEKTDARTTKYVFLGGQRVAAVTSSPSIGSTTLYYHADHLGGANVLTDATGFKKELIEYEPFGLESRHEKYGSSEEVAWYYFTGKPKDDETGLYYFGARYYDPSLGRFITPDTIVQDPYDPQTLNRYSYTSNNPVNRIDADGHKWSWKKFWHAAVGAIVGVVAGILLGPAGFALVGSTMAGIIGGAVGGAVTGGLEAGWKGALFGALGGGALGGLGAWGVGNYGWQFGAGMLVAGAGVAAATDSWDSFAGGLTGGILGGIGGNAFVKSEQFLNFKAGNGFRSNRSVTYAQYEAKIKAMHSLNVNQKNATVERISRPLGKAGGGPGSTTGPRHNAALSKDLANGQFQMGPDANGIIQTSDTIGDLQGWGTYQTTQESLALGGRYIDSITVGVNRQGLAEAINLYNQTFAGNFQYNALNHNSNYAVNSVIYGAGGNVPLGGQAVGRAPGFPDAP